jgi:hypothetical protein
MNTTAKVFQNLLNVIQNVRLGQFKGHMGPSRFQDLQQWSPASIWKPSFSVTWLILGAILRPIGF